MRGAPNKLAVLDPDATSGFITPGRKSTRDRRTSPSASSTTDPQRSVSSASRPWSSSPRSRAPSSRVRGCRSCPGPSGGPTPSNGRKTTLDRFRGIGVTTVFSHGAELELLRGQSDGVAVHDLVDVAHARRSTTFEGPQTADVAILQGTAGSTGTPRTAQISPAAALANLRGLITPSQHRRATAGCTAGCRSTTTWA